MQAITLYKQIHPCQCQALSRLGYKSLINLRFDGETDGQPTGADIKHSADNAGLSYHNLPIDGEHIHLSQVQTFAKLINDLPKPIMVFCGTGSRAKRLYQCAIVSSLL